MIESIRHKGLRRFYERDDRKLLSPDMVTRIRQILSALDQAKVVEDMNHPSLKLHSLKGIVAASGQ